MEAPAIETIEFDVVAGNYGEFIERLRTVLAEHEPAGDRRSVVDYRHAPHPVLPLQRRPHPPARWIRIILRFREGDHRVHETTLAVRDDNLFLIGFRNRQHQWYEFGFSGGRSTRLLPEEWNSTFLECDVGYGSLLVGGAMSLVGHRLGRLFAREAVRRLSAYEQAAPGGSAGAGGGVDELTRQHLARLVVMVCEAARMIPHCTTVLHGWDRLTGSALDERHVHLLWKWKVMSHAVLRWEQWRRNSMCRHVPVPPPPTWPPALLDRRVNVRNVGQALEIVQLLLNWPQETSLDAAADGDTILHYWHGAPVVEDGAHGGLGQHQQGQCMLEIYGVRAGFYMGGATISVFDGMRGQIIYSNDDDDDDEEEELGRTTASLDHGDVGDSETRHGRHFGEWMFAHLRSIYGWAGLGYWNRRSQRSKREKGMWSTLGHDLVLTGPYRAISAHGSVSIEIDNSTSTETDSNVELLGISTAETDYVRIDISKKDGGCHSDDAGRSRTTTTTLLWDCYNDDAAYDTVLTRTISTSHGPLDVTYAVLSNAVEGTVQVRLVLAQPGSIGGGGGDGDILVHGKITAGGRDLDAQSVLFCRDARERVAVTRDGSHVPLSRSVVAVPLASELLIAAALHTSVASPSSNHTAAATSKSRSSGLWTSEF